VNWVLTFETMKLIRRSIAAVAFSALALSAHAQPNEVVWHWFGNCSPNNKMGVRVVYQGKTIYQTSFAVCRLRRSDIPNEPEQRLLKFTLRANAKIFGDDFATLGTQEIEGDIWKAGGDPDALLLGVSFVTRDRILLNTIHIARPGRSARSVLAKGLSISTDQVPASR
jgi:hypothetical protein